ncbi:hypothetical protein Tco_1019305 [Tanacetum coccineum]|uniref:Uncharacterized protein n=1 Tax=Tanacetum coccineum TaxID=301880 RepID=A0ABQ5FX33_9ASTR
MASQDARLSKFEADFKRQQGEMTNKIDTVLKAITDQIASTLPSDTVKNPKLGTHPVSSARSYPTIDPQCSTQIHSSINTITIHPEDEFKDLHLNLPGSQRETPAKMGDPELFTLPCKLGDSKPFDTLADLGSCEISRDAELNPFKDTLVFRRMVEFLGAIPINLKCNMWESDDLIKKPINWDKPPKNEDGAWHAKIRLIDPDGEEFTNTLQSIPTTRKLSE